MCEMIQIHIFEISLYVSAETSIILLQYFVINRNRFADNDLDEAGLDQLVMEYQVGSFGAKFNKQAVTVGL
jgi:hypothetical protein